MPITFLFAFLFFLAIILAVLLIPISAVLFVLKMKKAALFVFLFPVCLLVFSICMTLFIFGSIWIHDFKVNIQPTRIYKTTFGLKPDKQTEVLETYVNSGLDYQNTFIKFRTTKDIIDKIVQNRFNAISSETFKEKHMINSFKLPGRVHEWFAPDYEKTNLFYIAEPFNNSFSAGNKAVLCYNEETGIAYFYWRGID